MKNIYLLLIRDSLIVLVSIFEGQTQEEYTVTFYVGYKAWRK